MIDIKKAQNTVIETLYLNYNFKNKTSLDDFVKTWDELTDYHYKFYTQKQISYEEQRKRRIVDLFEKHNIPHSEVCYVGDSYEKDILPCRELGVKAILINRTNKKHSDKNLIQIQNLNEITKQI